MGYKRRLRVLFIDGGSGAAARAARLAEHLGADRLEVRALAVADAAQLAWADLAISLVDAARDAPELPAHVRWRHWPLPAPEQARDRTLQERIRGVLGGLSLMRSAEPD